METCKACSQPLVLELDPDDFDEATLSSAGGSSVVVPDDLELPCRCHFHWQCLLDESPTIVISLSCPCCNSSVISTQSGPSATNRILPNMTQQPRILTRYHNEGGIQNNLDILPLITEEAYLSANPSARPARAYMTMCAEGDVVGVVELLQTIQDEDNKDEEGMSAADLLRYQDPLDHMVSALHVAIEKGQEEVVWLLLWLSSDLQTEKFPAEAIHAAESIRAPRDFAGAGIDIRSLKDDRGETAGVAAKRIGGPWVGLVEAGILIE